MEALAATISLPALPQLLQVPLLAATPGPVFGFLIDHLQHWGKVVEEASLLVAMIVALGVLGGAAGVALERRPGFRAGLAAAALAWLVICLILLPLGGLGPFGLSAGLQVAVEWGLVMAVYALLWEALYARGPATAVAHPGRRRLLALLPAAAAIGGLAVIGGFRLPVWYRTAVQPPEKATGAVPEVTPAANFYQVSKNIDDPVVDGKSWSLRVEGLVSHPLRLDARQLAALPAVTQVYTLECISNEVGGPLMSTGRFTGVPLRDLLAMAAPKSGATAVNFTSRDGYTETLPLHDVMASADILVAYRLNGADLPAAHGYPARVIVPGHYGMKGPKWLDEIRLADSPAGGYWEGQGWNPAAPVRTIARIDTPANLDAVSRYGVTIAGVAFAGDRGIRAVEWSTDGGASWQPAQLAAPLSAYTWVLWRADWSPPKIGVFKLVARATDGHGTVQPDSFQPSFPSGSGGYHRVTVQVGL